MEEIRHGDKHLHNEVVAVAMVAEEPQHLVGALELEQWIMKAAGAGEHQEGECGLCSDLSTWVRLWQTQKG